MQCSGLSLPQKKATLRNRATAKEQPEHTSGWLTFCSQVNVKKQNVIERISQSAKIIEKFWSQSAAINPLLILTRL